MLERLNFGVRRSLPLVLQTESSECSLACLAMVAGYHGYHADMRVLRQRFPISLKGANFNLLIKIAERLQLATRAVRLELEELSQLRLPCVLHWNMNHFVVLRSVGKHSVVIHDPAHGRREIALSDASKAFTGVALELWPNPDFVLQDPPPSLPLRRLLGRATGLKRSFAQALLLAAALEAFALVSPFLMQWTIDDVIVGSDRELLATLIVGFGLLMLAQQAVGAIRTWVLMYLSTSLSVQWRTNVFTHLLNLPTQYFERRHVGDVVSRFGSVDTIQQTLTTSFLSAVLDGIMTIATLGLMLAYSPKLAAISVAAMALYGLGRTLWYRPLRNATEDQIIRSAKTQSHFLETIRGVRAIQLFQRRQERRSTWLSLLIEQINAGLRTQKLRMAYQQWNGVVFGAENLAVVWLGAIMVMSGEFTVGMLVAFTAYKGSFNSRVGNLIDKYFEVKMLQIQGQRLADIVMTPPDAGLTDADDELRAEELAGSIELRGVQYRYAHGENTVLNGIDLSIASGESVAIVGTSGCGKTTLVNLLLGVLKPTRGEILVGGMALDRLGTARLRQMTGTVMQDDVLFAGSIADNISFFDPQADQEWIEECARMAGVHFEIAEMPMGYRTLVGDMGTMLSGGQKQRIFIARALYKRPKILILDEATSHLDVMAERRINAAVRSLNVTRIIVAHRPETIASADRVVVLNFGKVIKDGPPDARDPFHVAHGVPVASTPVQDDPLAAKAS